MANAELKLNTDREKVALEDLSKEDLMNFVSQLLLQDNNEVKNDRNYVAEPIILSDEQFDQLLTEKDFLEGVKIGMKLLGLYSTLAGGGVSLETAEDVMVNQHTYENSIELTREQTLKVEESKL